MYSFIKSTKYLKAPYFESLCHFSCLCKKRKEIKLRKKAAARFEELLDIRSFVSVHTNLALLLSMLLSNEQLMLFQNHRAHAILQKRKKDDKGTAKSSDRQRKDIIKKALGSSQGLPELRLGNKSSEQLKEGFKQLLGFNARSKLDQELLAGIFDKEVLKMRPEAHTSDKSLVSVNHIFTTS